MVSITKENITLRDMKESDIEDYIRWYTDPDMDWQDTDSPWETLTTTPEEEKEAWKLYYDSVKNLTDDKERWKFEIEVDGVHIGWVSSYRDLEYLENPDNHRAIGIDICENSFRSKGIGTKALEMIMDYYKARGHKFVFTQTWSGNKSMLKVAEKLGFSQLHREENLRSVNGKNYDGITFIKELI